MKIRNGQASIDLRDHGILYFELLYIFWSAEVEQKFTFLVKLMLQLGIFGTFQTRL